jgi:pimeloyl-ACP methyl ester carboxylesterase
MGGMIAQIVAIEHPERVKSLTSIMSTTGDRQNQLWANPWYEAKNLRNDVQREFNFEAYELLLRGREQALALTRAASG